MGDSVHDCVKDPSVLPAALEDRLNLKLPGPCLEVTMPHGMLWGCLFTALLIL